MNGEEPPQGSGADRLGLLVASAFALGGGAYALAQRRIERSEPCTRCGEIIVDTKISARYGRGGYYHSVCPKEEAPKVPKAASAIPD